MVVGLFWVIVGSDGYFLGGGGWWWGVARFILTHYDQLIVIFFRSTC